MWFGYLYSDSLITSSTTPPRQGRGRGGDGRGRHRREGGRGLAQGRRRGGGTLLAVVVAATSLLPAAGAIMAGFVDCARPKVVFFGFIFNLGPLKCATVMANCEVEFSAKTNDFLVVQYSSRSSSSRPRPPPPSRPPPPPPPPPSRRPTRPPPRRQPLRRFVDGLLSNIHM